MARNLKFLGIAVLALLAFGAFTASGALAKGEFTVEGNVAAVLTGIPEETEKFSTTAGSFTCPEAKYDATIAAGGSPTTDITATPTYGDCLSGGIIPVVVDKNGCDYTFTIDPLSEKTEGWVDIVCPTGNEITVTANQNTAGTLTTKCTVHIPPQTVSGVTYTNQIVNNVKKITIDVNTESITYSETAGTGLGACATSNPLLQHNGTYTAKTWVTCYKDLSAPGEPYKHNNEEINCDIG